MKYHHYAVYITTNPKRKVLYVGVTNDLERRMLDHMEDNENDRKTFAGKYFCYNLIYFELFQDIKQAIAREKEIKAWSRSKKEKLIDQFNPEWKFLNNEIKEA